MRYLFILFLIGINLTSFAKKNDHDMPLAFFNLQIEIEEVNLMILFDKEDFNLAVGHRTSLLPKEQLENYLLKNTIWLFNEEEAIMEICLIEQKDDHYQIEAHFAHPNQQISKVKIINSCLINEIENHSNILNVSYEGRQRSFRMHKERKETFFELR